MFGLEGISSSSAVVPEKEGSQHGVADAELTGDVYRRGLGRKAYQEGESGHLICAEQCT